MAEFSPTTVAELISAINSANGNNEVDTIHLTSSGTYTFTGAISGSENALPVITKPLVIEGNNATLKPSTAHPDYRLLEIHNNTTVIINDVTVQDFGGTNVQNGGALFVNIGDLDLQDSTLINNKAQRGGAIYLRDLLGLALVNDDNGKLAVCRDYLATNPLWQDLSSHFTGNICDFDWDYNSDYFTNGNSTSDPLSVYVVTIIGTTFYVYRIEDIQQSTISVTQLTSETMADASMQYNARIVCSKTTPTLACAIWKDQTGVEHVYTTNGGSTWSSKANIGSVITDTDNDDAPLGLDIFDETILVTAPDSTPEYGLYISTASTPSFSEVTSSLKDSVPISMIKLIDDTNAYVSIRVSTSIDVDFDGGWSNYEFTPETWTDTYGEATGGNPGNCYKVTAATPAGPDSGDLIISLPVDAVANQIEIDLDYYFDCVFGTSINTIVAAYNGSTHVRGTTFPGSNDATWHSASISIFVLDDPKVVNKVRFTPLVGLGGAVEWRLDNIVITYFVRTLQKVSSLTGTSSWTDVSPSTDRAPVRPHDLAIDLLDSDVINTVADDDKWYQSSYAGSNWTTEETNTSKRTPSSDGDVILFGGSSDVEIALDGTNFEDKTGNLAAVWSSVGLIKRIVGL